MENPKLFNFAIIWHPDEKQSKEGEKSIIIKEPTLVLALNQHQVLVQAAMEIPNKYKDQLDQVEIVTRPF